MLYDKLGCLQTLPCSGCDSCGTYTNDRGTISDGIDDDYLPSSNCKWIIAPTGVSQVSLYFSYVRTSSSYYTTNVDSVKIYQCTDITCSSTQLVETLSGYVGAWTSTVASPYMLVHFTTDNDGYESTGFVATWIARDVSYPC
jgi:hypothetical protein